jgi:putative ATPase
MDLFQARDRERRARSAPLAERMRPAVLEDVLGLEAILAPDSALRRLLTGPRLVSMILWGPPGSGKTTLARVLANNRQLAMESLSAVSAGVKELREVVARARERSAMEQRGTVLFLDEIHRFNKAQQDALLPHIEDGSLVLIGATTENPSLEINRALLSRCRLITLEALPSEALASILRRALADSTRGIGDLALAVPDTEIELIARLSAGDARAALNLLEASAIAAEAAGEKELSSERILAIAQQPLLAYDKAGDEHYNALSALHKSVRGSDVDAAIYWVTRMLESGEPPMTIARRLVRIASEDIGLADPQALSRAVAALEAARFLGRPEGDLALVQAAADLALAPKSNALELAWMRARDDVQDFGAAPVPLHLRNIKPGLSPDEAVATRYRYAHDYRYGIVPQHHLPKLLRRESSRLPYFRPTSRERAAQKRLVELEAWRQEASRLGEPRWRAAAPDSPAAKPSQAQPKPADPDPDDSPED